MGEFQDNGEENIPDLLQRGEATSRKIIDALSSGSEPGRSSKQTNSLEYDESDIALQQLEGVSYLENSDIRDYEVVDQFLGELTSIAKENTEAEQVPDHIDAREGFDGLQHGLMTRDIQSAITHAYEAITQKGTNRRTEEDVFDQDLGIRNDNEHSLWYWFEQAHRYREHSDDQPGDWRNAAVEFMEDLTTSDSNGSIVKAADLLADSERDYSDKAVYMVTDVDEEDYQTLKQNIEDTGIPPQNLKDYLVDISNYVRKAEN